MDCREILQRKLAENENLSETIVRENLTGKSVHEHFLWLICRSHFPAIFFCKSM